jgi:hypothetical protein
MREVDIGGAIASGFKLIGREPLAFLAWAVVYAVVGLAPQLLITGSTFNALSAIDPAKAQDPAAIQALMGPMQALQPLTLITTMAAWVLLYGAIFRAALYPDDRRYLYLRLGQRELWMGLTLLVLMVLYGLSFVAMLLPLIVIVGVGAAAGGGGAGMAAALLIGVPVVFAVFMWGASRLSVALPMSFAQRAFILPEAWRETHGHAGRIFLVFLGLFAILLLGELVVLGVGLGLVAALVPLPELGRAFTENPAKLFSQINPAVWVAVTFVWALLGAASAALFSAALAHIYRDLSPEDPAEVFA